MSAVASRATAVEHPLMKEVLRLQRVVEDQGAEIRDLRRALAPAFIPPDEWKLPRREVEIFAALLTADVVSKERIRFALYGANSDLDPMGNAIESHMSKMRAKLRRFGVRITNKRYLGYSLVDRHRFLGGDH